MRKNLFIFLILTFFSYPSFAEIDGKSLICKCKSLTNNPDCKKPFIYSDSFANPLTHLGIYFEKGFVSLFHIVDKTINNKKTIVLQKEKNKFEYTIEPSFVYWPPRNVWIDEEAWDSNVK